MKSRIKIAVKAACFVLLTCLCVWSVNELLKPKYYYNDDWPSTNTFQDFYRLEKNSVDVLMFGSSHAMCALDPLVLYDNYGITSYNLSSEQQSLVVTYYWLREALKYQTPKAVIVDTYMLHKFSDNYIYNEMNCSEGAVRKAMDNMRLSPLKWEAAQVIEKLDPTQDALSYLLLNIRYHTRWTDLGEGDYTQNAMVAHGALKGYAMMDGADPNLEYTPFTAAEAETADPDIMMGASKEYLDKIVALCKEEGIQLILANIPCAETAGRYISTKDYADANGVPYYDFNEESLYRAIQYDASQDLLSHPNYRGAEKVSNYLGKVLVEEYGVTPRTDASYDACRALHDHIMDNFRLSQTEDMRQYLSLLENDAYTVFIFGSTAFSAGIDESLMNQLFALGFETELREVPDGYHYCAVKDGDRFVEQLTDKDLQVSGSIRGGLVPYVFQVDTRNMTQKTYSLTLDGVEYAQSGPGLNFIVYDNEMKEVVDRVCFDTTTPELTAAR
ncbi:MAG: hypothetical protein DBX91_09220 [Subdoligranulum variabile]|nr:MAG: hypothetical protein DBX91_09220 [Subdoligranulum variabile]